MFTDLDSSRLNTWVWILLGLYWAYGAFFLKPVQRRERATSSAGHVLLIIAALFLLFSRSASVRPLDDRFVPEMPWIAWTGFALTVAGCGFAAWARAFLGSNWSAAVMLRESHELIRSGPYALVRHPIYAGLLLALLGTGIQLGQMRGLAAFGLAFVAWFIKTRHEERFMVDRFDGEYIRYRRSVKRLIPFFF